MRVLDHSICLNAWQRFWAGFWIIELNSRSSHLHGGMFRSEGRGFSGDVLYTADAC